MLEFEAGWALTMQNLARNKREPLRPEEVVAFARSTEFLSRRQERDPRMATGAAKQVVERLLEMKELAAGRRDRRGHAFARPHAPHRQLPGDRRRLDRGGLRPRTGPALCAAPAHEGHHGGVTSSRRPTPRAIELADHWAWRPEWTPERTCLYWYLTFRADDIAAAIGDDALDLVRRTRWLDAVPPEWCHVTIADVGFTDQLEPSDAEHVRAAVADEMAGQGPLRLALGPMRTFATAVVVSVGPVERLRDIRARVRRATSATIGARHADFHRHPYRPHMTLGYAHEAVGAEAATPFGEALPEVSSVVDVDALTLVAVTRRDHAYRWEVRAQVPLLGGTDGSG